MRLNAVPPSVVTQPETRPEVGAVRGARAIGPQTPGPGMAPQRPAEATPAVEPVPQEDRRARPRRGKDRREKRVPVLIDTRVADRRRQRRRASDEAPATIDLEA